MQFPIACVRNYCAELVSRMFSRLGSLFKEGQMIPTKAYAAQNATTDPTPWSFEYREPGLHEILIDITFSNP
jgi:hypothetical protein